ncbi:MAG: aminotransferase class V-fold PLP-dependent enzyme [Bacteroidota bacterium]
MSTRRKFLQRFATFTATTSLPFYNTLAGQQVLTSIKKAATISPNDLANDETFWHTIKQAYTVSPTFVNLNNGGVSPSPKVVQEAVERYNQWSNELPSHYMWHILDANGKEPLRQKLAEIAGCPPDEIAIHRNTTESLANVIFGLPLKAGDEIVLSKQDYPNMINAWKQRQHRDGIVLKWVNLDPVMESEAALVEKYTALFSPKTKLVHLTHLINWSGQMLPVQTIADQAKAQNIEVLVDGAHTFGQINYAIPDLNCDYFGTSLHKWLCAPFGSGLLYVRKEKIAPLYPLMAAPNFTADDIRKFEHLGTRSIPIEQAIGQAADFHLMIGADRKEARLRYLKDYWTAAVQKISGVSLATPKNPALSGAIALFNIAGKTPHEVAGQLMSQFKIHSVAIVWENIRGVRITPNVYTLTNDLDRFVAAVKKIAK